MNNAERPPLEYPKGLWINPPHQNSPDFLKARIKISKEQFLAWLQSKQGTQGKQGEEIHLDIRKSKEKNDLYITVNNWRPDPNYKKGAADKEVASYDLKPNKAFTTDEIPF